MATAEAPANRRLALDEDLTIYNAAVQKQQLLSLLDECRGVDLDLARVQAIDAAGLQLLIMLKREAAARGTPVNIVAHSEAVRSVIEFCNMAAAFGDPLLMPAAN